MKNREPSDRLSDALRALDARPASDGFTERVLDGLDARDARRRRRAAGVVLAAAAALAVAVLAPLVIGRPAASPPGAESSAARAEEIRRQQRLVEAELERLRRASHDARPVLYLGSAEDYDLVLDLTPLLEEPIGSPVVPALQDLRVRRPRALETAARRP